MGTICVQSRMGLLNVESRIDQLERCQDMPRVTPMQLESGFSVIA